MPQLSVDSIREQFPALNPPEGGRAPIYFDNGATVLKPRPVIDAIAGFLSTNGSNVHRGIHFLSVEGSEQVESARVTIARFVGADGDEIVYVRNATEAINLVAQSLPAGSRVVVTGLEHHSNLLPWRHRHDVRLAPLLPDGTVDMEKFEELIRDGADLVACAHISNVLGVVMPLDRIVETAHAAGAQVLVDGAQAAAHLEVDVREIDCDYYAFSAHKLGGPTGIGALYGKRAALEKLEPLVWGGNMVSAVHVEGHTLQDAPVRFEAGTPAIEATLGFEAACDFLDDIGRDAIFAHEHELALYARKGLSGIDRIRIHGPADGAGCAGIVTFEIPGIPANMIAKVLSDRANICVRSGFLCAQPAHELMVIEPSVRASFFAYNSTAEIDAMLEVLETVARTA